LRELPAFFRAYKFSSLKKQQEFIVWIQASYKSHTPLFSPTNVPSFQKAKRT